MIGQHGHYERGCPHPSFDWQLVVEVGEVLADHGFRAGDVGDLELVALEDGLHRYLFGGSCEGAAR